MKNVATFRGERIDDQPVADWPSIQKECARHERFVVEVRKFDEEREISLQQMAWLHTCAFPALAKHWDCSQAEAELRAKRQWAENWLIKRELGYIFVLSKTILLVKQCSAWIENILDGAHSEGLLLPPPDKDWRERDRKLAKARNG